MNQDLLSLIALHLPIKSLYHFLLVWKLNEYYWHRRLLKDYNRVHDKSLSLYIKYHQFKGGKAIVSYENTKDICEQLKWGDLLITNKSYPGISTYFYDGKRLQEISHSTFFYYRGYEIINKYDMYYWDINPNYGFKFVPSAEEKKVLSDNAIKVGKDYVSWFTDWRGNKIILVYPCVIHPDYVWKLSNCMLRETDKYDEDIEQMVSEMMLTGEYYGVLYYAKDKFPEKTHTHGFKYFDRS